MNIPEMMSHHLLGCFCRTCTERLSRKAMAPPPTRPWPAT